MYGDDQNSICLHELLHFYTHKFIEPIFLDAKQKKKFYDFKESLTFLLNIEFVNEMENMTDYGYKEHQNLRKELQQMWTKDKNIYQLTKKYLKNL